VPLLYMYVIGAVHFAVLIMGTFADVRTKRFRLKRYSL
jgi:hypothetical protein